MRKATSSAPVAEKRPVEHFEIEPEDVDLSARAVHRPMSGSVPAYTWGTPDLHEAGTTPRQTGAETEGIRSFGD